MNARGTNTNAKAGWSRHLSRSDLQGLMRLGASAVGGAADLAETWQRDLMGRWLANGIAGRISAAAYARVRWSARRVDEWAVALLGSAEPGPGAHESSAEREAVLAALNGVIGDRLAASGNPLAIPMRLRRGGHALTLEKAALARELPGAGGKILVLVHGLCRNDLQWQRNGHDHGEALAKKHGYTPVYLHYNTGRHVAENGLDFARLMEELFAAWPVKVEEIAIIGHSMGGLVARSACHHAVQAGFRWPRRLRHLVFLGTPHHGAPLERGSNWLAELAGGTALTAPFARLARLRSAGITDLRHGNLLEEDWRDHHRFEEHGDNRTPVPLPERVHCFAVAGTTGRRRGDIRDRLLGDGVIPLDTALGRHSEAAHTLLFPEEHQWIAFGIHHLDLLSRPEVYERLEAWLATTESAVSRARQPSRRPPRPVRNAAAERSDEAPRSGLRSRKARQSRQAKASPPAIAGETKLRRR